LFHFSLLILDIRRIPWTGVQPDLRPLSVQHNTTHRINGDEDPYLEWDSISRSQNLNG
jgi:hypothetical protein